MTAIGALLRTAYQAGGMPAVLFARLTTLEPARLRAAECERAELVSVKASVGVEVYP